MSTVASIDRPPYLGGGRGVLAGAFLSQGFLGSGFLALGAGAGGGGGSTWAVSSVALGSPVEGAGAVAAVVEGSEAEKVS